MHSNVDVLVPRLAPRAGVWRAQPFEARLVPLGPEVHGRVIFSGRDGGVGDAGVECVFVVAPGAGERGAAVDLGWQGGIELGGCWADDSGVGPGEEDGESTASRLSW